MEFSSTGLLWCMDDVAMLEFQRCCCALQIRAVSATRSRDIDHPAEHSQPQSFSLAKLRLELLKHRCIRPNRSLNNSSPTDASKSNAIAVTFEKFGSEPQCRRTPLETTCRTIEADGRLTASICLFLSTRMRVCAAPMPALHLAYVVHE